MIWASRGLLGGRRYRFGHFSWFYYGRTEEPVTSESFEDVIYIFEFLKPVESFKSIEIKSFKQVFEPLVIEEKLTIVGSETETPFWPVVFELELPIAASEQVATERQPLWRIMFTEFLREKPEIRE